VSSKRSTNPGSSSTPSAGGGGSAYPQTVDRLISEFARLPGIGRRSAERLAFHVLKSQREEAERLAEAISAVKRSVRHCAICFNFTDGDQCALCSDSRRDASMVLVVEQPRDLIALEQTGMYRGVYHVLLGRLSPLDGIGPSDLTIADLLRRIDDPASNARGEAVREVILGLNPTLEGDGTGLYLSEELKSRKVRVSRLARGLPSGGSLEFANKAVLADAIEGRQSLH
jgi:recombination protein RecR